MHGLLGAGRILMGSFGGNIVTETFSQQIYNFLRDAILRGDYRCGDIINAKSVSQECGVSIMPVREALKHLEQTGLIEIKPRSMCVVKTPSKKTIVSAIQIRELLEVFCVEQIYSSVSLDQLSKLKEYNNNMSSILAEKKEDMGDFTFYDWKFHCELCNILDNEFINAFYPELYIKVNMSTMYEIGTEDICYQDFVKEHNDLVHALECHSKEAVSIIKQHLKNSQNNILKGKLFS